MKEDTVNLRVSESDKETLRQASENLEKITNEKPSISKTIRESLKLMADQDPNKPELFYVNRKSLRDIDKNLEYGTACIQNIIDEYQKITKVIPSIQEISEWYSPGSNGVTRESCVKESVYSKLFEAEKKKSPGRKVNLDTIEEPDMSDLLHAAHQLIFIPEVDNHRVLYWQAFKIKAGKVEIIPEEIEIIKSPYRIYAETPEEKTRLADVRKLCEAHNAFKMRDPEYLNIRGVCYYDSEAGVYVPHEDYVKGFIS